MPVVTYTIRKGDSLSAIALKFGVPLGVLIDSNGITEPNKIMPGQELKIPPMTTDLSDHPEFAAPPPLTRMPSALAVNQKKFRLRPALDFHLEETKKDLVVLHYTAGPTVQSAFNTWTGAANQVATAYLIDLDGTIYEFFDPKFWAFHLGFNADGKHKDHRRSIGIELINVGGLKPDRLDPGQLNWWANKFGTKYCRKSDTDMFVDRNFRGVRYHPAFPKAQLQSTVELVNHLCDRFAIPTRIPPASQRQSETPDTNFATKFSGVISHQSFSNQRIDIGPAFDWTMLFT